MFVLMRFSPSFVTSTVSARDLCLLQPSKLLFHTDLPTRIVRFLLVSRMRNDGKGLLRTKRASTVARLNDLLQTELSPNGENGSKIKSVGLFLWFITLISYNISRLFFRLES
jgi:hypothetical protein